MQPLARLQEAMRAKGVDALLLGGEGAGRFAAGHTRIGVFMPGWPLPVTVVTASGPPHIVTADPDGATHLPADHVHGMMWNPATLIERLPQWLGDAAAGTVGVDVLSPGGLDLVRAAIPAATLVDASGLLAEVMAPKDEAEQRALAAACTLAHRAAEAGLAGGLPATVEALGGVFPAGHPRIVDGSAAVAVLLDGFVGEARLGPGSADALDGAVALIRPGVTTDELAAGLAPDVEVVGLGRGYEAPLVRAGAAAPPGFRLPEGAVLLVRTATMAVTVVVGDPPRYLSPKPSEVVR